MELGWLHAYVGQLAGVGASLLWTVTTLFFTAAGRHLGATAVNATRISFACILLAVTHRCLQGVWIPEVPWTQAAFLGVSGIVGLTIGDQAIIAAFVEIGPRLALLVTTTSPLWAAFFGRVFLGEHLPGAAWLGLAMTIGGILCVIGERRYGSAAIPRSKLVRGVLLALLAALCQSGGYLLSKMGMGHGEGGHHVDAQAATLIRMIFAAMTIVPALAAQIWVRRRSTAAIASPAHAFSRSDEGAGHMANASAWRVGMLLSLCGAVTGPYFGVWLSLIACDRAPLGVAQTLLTLSPAFILPATAIMHRERISLRSAIGALIAIGGAAALFGI
ncbi:MAG: DMT family transporter [Planctomycetota bacterium]